MSPVVSWCYLFVAIITGVLGTINMKLSHGLKYSRPTILSLFFYVICFIALTLTLKHIELSVVYAVWSGLGTVIVSLVGIFHFGERASKRKALYLFLIIVGIIGIHVSAFPIT